jgi:hypothetical protein
MKVERDEQAMYRHIAALLPDLQQFADQ